MKILAIISALFLVVMIAGCTTRNVYETLRVQQGMECQNLQGRDRDECERRTGMSYDEYQKQLKNGKTSSGPR